MEIMKKYRKILYIFLFMTAFSSSGQGYFLSPCVHFEDKIPAITEYNKKLEKVLSENFCADYIVRFIAKPSDEPEYAFQIEEKDSSVYEIYSISLSVNLWNTQYADSVFGNKREINKDFVVEIGVLFKRLMDYKSTNSAYGLGEGGVNYNFFYRSESEESCVEVWSHRTNSFLGEVIQLCNTIMLYSQNEDVNLKELCHKVKLIIKQLE